MVVTLRNCTLVRPFPLSLPSLVPNRIARLESVLHCKSWKSWNRKRKFRPWSRHLQTGEMLVVLCDVSRNKSISVQRGNSLLSKRLLGIGSPVLSGREYRIDLYAFSNCFAHASKSNFGSSGSEMTVSSRGQDGNVSLCSVCRAFMIVWQ